MATKEPDNLPVHPDVLVRVLESLAQPGGIHGTVIKRLQQPAKDKKRSS